MADEPSVWSRLANLFKRTETSDEEDTSEDPTADEGVEDDTQAVPELEARYDGRDDAAEPGLGSASHAVAARHEADADELPVEPEEPAAVSPPQDFRFPWTKQGSLPPARPSHEDIVSEDLVSIDDLAPTDDASALIEEIVLEEGDGSAPSLEAPSAPSAPDEPRKSRGFLAKLFGKNADEQAAPLAARDEPVEVSASDDALGASMDIEIEHEEAASMEIPMDEDRRDTAEMESVSADPFEPATASGEEPGDDAADDDRPGFFGRLFGRGRKDEAEPVGAGSADSTDWTSLDTRGVDAITPRDTVTSQPEPETADVSMMGGPDPFTPIRLREPGAFAETIPTTAGLPFDVSPQEVGAATLEAEIGERRTDEFAQPDIPKPGEGEADTADLEPQAGLLARLFRRKRTSAETAQEQEVEPGFLHAKFRQFYSEILRFKNQKSQVAAGFATAIVDYHADISPEATALQLSNRLKELLELQAAEASWMKGEYAQRYPDAQYAMAALADEIFSGLDWPGRIAYPQYRLETRLFKSNAADVELFKRADRLLREERPSPEARDLARVYLLVLASGFRGKWAPFNLVRPIADYRRRLYEFICGGDALLLYGDDTPLMPQAVTHTLRGHAVSRFTAAQRWTAMLVILIVGYVIVANVAWTRVSADIKDLTGRIVASSGPRGAP